MLAAAVWFLGATCVASRVHLVMGYRSVPAGPPELELFLASHAAWLFTATVAGLWLVAWWRCQPAQRVHAAPQWRIAAAWAVAGGLPGACVLARAGGWQTEPGYWEPLWIAAWSGLSGGWLVQQRNWPQRSQPRQPRWDVAVVSAAAVTTATWWYLQTCDLYENFLLGYNDFGHFGQRIANTAAGRGWLLESPVLPRFWDHFNPGLLLLVPAWAVFPHVDLFFVLQALSLASGSVLVWGLARQMNYEPLPAIAFGLAWLAQPVLGQMNLAYTYGWHPISLAIPLLLGAVWSLVAGRRGLAAGLSLLAMSMEEGVIVVTALFCGACGMLAWLEQRGWLRGGSHPAGQVFGIAAGSWLLATAATAVGFLVVYRFSGIAEFQTGRFVALGNSPAEIVLSPVLRPEAFWGAIFRWDKLAFCLSLWIPCFLPSLIRGWRWMLPSLLPLLVLIVWDHKPATSLAFQYSSALLPLFWLAALDGGRAAPRLSATAALLSGLVLSLYAGQLPYSSPTLLDVIGHTYQTGSEGEVAWGFRRTDAADGQWLTQQVARVRVQAGPVLATGRIAAHLVGNEDVETVGQFLERSDRLAELPDRRDNPLGHYRWIVLDRREAFQQDPTSTAAVEQSARQAGFQVTAEAYDVLVMERGGPP